MKDCRGIEDPSPPKVVVRTTDFEEGLNRLSQDTTCIYTYSRLQNVSRGLFNGLDFLERKRKEFKVVLKRL